MLSDDVLVCWRASFNQASSCSASENVMAQIFKREVGLNASCEDEVLLDGMHCQALGLLSAQSDTVLN